MMHETPATCPIDIRAEYRTQKDCLLALLLRDRTTGNHIVWATDAYQAHGAAFEADMEITPALVTGVYGTLIQPRVAKPREEQIRRTKNRGEVCTPLWAVKHMNDACDTTRVTKQNWQAYVGLLKLEITCGEAPFIVTRYNPVGNAQEILPLNRRVGFLDTKLRIVSRYCDNHTDWMHWATIAFQSSYGYEWQGDNLLIARENLLYTFIEYYHDTFNKIPARKLQRAIAEIIVWNMFQMDGLRYVVPGTPVEENVMDDRQGVLFESDTQCKKTNTQYVKIMDWREGREVQFIDLVK